MSLLIEVKVTSADGSRARTLSGSDLLRPSKDLALPRMEHYILKRIEEAERNLAAGTRPRSLSTPAFPVPGNSTLDQAKKTIRSFTSTWKGPTLADAKELLLDLIDMCKRNPVKTTLVLIALALLIAALHFPFAAFLIAAIFVGLSVPVITKIENLIASYFPKPLSQ